MKVPDPRFLKMMPSLAMRVNARLIELRLTLYSSASVRSSGRRISLNSPEKILFLLTDSDNYIIDLHLEQIDDPHALAEYLIHQVGVVEHGLFLDMVNDVIVGKQVGPVVLHARD